MEICHPQKNITDYLDIPTRPSLDIDEMKSEFCSVNYTKIQDEITRVFNIDYIMEQVSLLSILRIFVRKKTGKHYQTVSSM